jgi:transcriptional regulator with XRE-family HTH domain
VRHRNPVGIGARLRQIRGERTQAQFAALLGFHKNSYADWEREKAEIGAGALGRLGELGISADWVLRGEGPMRLLDGQMGILDRQQLEAERSQPARLDLDKLRSAIEAVELALAASERSVDPTGKADLVVKVYETFLQEADVGKATTTVFRLIRTGT